jgi:hypothetical protein
MTNQLAVRFSRAKTSTDVRSPTFEAFEKELNRLVESFGQRVAELKRPLTSKRNFATIS